MNSQTELSTSIKALPSHWIEKMFDKMLLDYGKKFTDQWAGAEPEKLIAHWAQGLAGFTNAELKRGYDALENREWPPSLPEFKKMCRPPVDPMVAYYEAVAGIQARAAGEMGKWSHPAIFWAAMPMAFDLGNQTFSQVKGRWERSLSEQMDRGEWDPIPAQMLALPEPGKSLLSRESAAKMLQDLGASDVLKPKTNHTAWYRDILAREKSGDKTLSMVQKNFAREAAVAHGYQS